MSNDKKELLTNIAPFGLRLQPDLKERIKLAAEKNGNSMNSEIVATLEAAYPKVLDFEEFLHHWSQGISIAKTEEQRRKIIAIANDAARKSGANYRIIETKKNDVFTITLFFIDNDLVDLPTEDAYKIHEQRRHKMTDEEADAIWEMLQEYERKEKQAKSLKEVSPNDT